MTPTNISAINIIMQGDIWSKIVLVVLFIMSIASWSIILKKWVLITTANRASKQFLNGIAEDDGISEIEARIKSFPRSFTANLAGQIIDGMDKLSRLRPGEAHLEDRVERLIERSIINNKEQMQKGLSWLATISSSAPFIGLLGTVLGIINSFYSIAAKGASSIAVVAPGLSAALVATAVGLFTAIPALIAYNVFRAKIKELATEMISFGLDIQPIVLSTLITRQRSLAMVSKNPKN